MDFKVIDAIPIPSRFFFYKIADQKVFPILGRDGEIASGLGAYLMEKLPNGCVPMGIKGLQERDGGRWYSILLHISDSAEDIKHKIQTAIDTLDRR